MPYDDTMATSLELLGNSASHAAASISSSNVTHCQPALDSASNFQDLVQVAMSSIDCVDVLGLWEGNELFALGNFVCDFRNAVDVEGF